MSGYFSSDSQVLLSNGRYTNIANVAVGDSLLDNRGNVVRVLGVKKVELASFTAIRYQNWYSPLYCTDDLGVMVGSDIVKAGKLEKDTPVAVDWKIYKSRLPTDFPDATYNLGLVFGLYAGYGSIVDGKIVFRFGPNDQLAGQVTQLMRDLFEATTVVIKDEHCYQLIVDSTAAVELFAKFGSKIERKIPQEYWCKNEVFVRGLYDGLIDYDLDSKISRYIPVSREMAEAFVWCCAVLGMSFINETPKLGTVKMQVYPLFVTADADGKVYNNEDSGITQAGWNLQVDNDSNTFIVNNVAVVGYTGAPGYDIQEGASAAAE